MTHCMCYTTQSCYDPLHMLHHTKGHIPESLLDDTRHRDDFLSAGTHSAPQKIVQLKMDHLREVDKVNPKGQIGWMVPSGCQPCKCDVDRPLPGSRVLGGNGKAVHGRLQGDAASSSAQSFRLPWLLPHPAAPVRPGKELGHGSRIPLCRSLSGSVHCASGSQLPM